MKIFYTILLTILSKLALAQFAVIDDKDGYSNVRRTAEAGNNVQDKLENGHFVYIIKKGNQHFAGSPLCIILAFSTSV